MILVHITQNYHQVQDHILNKYKYDKFWVWNNINKKELLNYISTLLDNSALSVLFSGAISIDQLPNNSLINKGTLLSQNGFAQVKLPKDININHPNKEDTEAINELYAKIHEEVIPPKKEDNTLLFFFSSEKEHGWFV